MIRAANGTGYRQVADKLRAQIRNGRITPGQTLPSIQNLMAEHQVSAGVVRDALKMLARERLIETKQGVGSTVLNPEEWTSTEATELMQLVGTLRDEVHDLRQRVESVERRLPRSVGEDRRSQRTDP